MKKVLDVFAVTLFFLGLVVLYWPTDLFIYSKLFGLDISLDLHNKLIAAQLGLLILSGCYLFIEDLPKVQSVQVGKSLAIWGALFLTWYFSPKVRTNLNIELKVILVFVALHVILATICSPLFLKSLKSKKP